MDRVAKEKVVSDLTKKFDESNFFILTHNNGLSVYEITSLRNKLREAGSTFKVVKNSLAKIAVNDTKVKDLSEYFNGPRISLIPHSTTIALAFCVAWSISLDEPEVTFSFPKMISSATLPPNIIASLAFISVFVSEYLSLSGRFIVTPKALPLGIIVTLCNGSLAGVKTPTKA